MHGLTAYAAPSTEPITLAQAKLHLELDADVTKYDALIEAELIPAARQWCEHYTGRALVDQTWELALDDFADNEIWLPKPPLIEVVSIAYTDTNGTGQTLATTEYTVDNSFPTGPRIVPAWDKIWPAVRGVPAAVRVRFRAGYARAGSPDESLLVPQPLRSAMKIVIGALFENREMGDVPKSAEHLARPYRIEGLGA